MIDVNIDFYLIFVHAVSIFDCVDLSTTKLVLKPEMPGEKSEKSLNIHVKNPF